MKLPKSKRNYRLLDWQRQAILDAYLAGEKVESISNEFGVDVAYPCKIAKRRGYLVRTRANGTTGQWQTHA